MSILDRPIVRLNVTSAGYAAAIGTRIVEGRWMTDAEPSAVYVINEALARRYFPGENPIGWLAARAPSRNARPIALSTAL